MDAEAFQSLSTAYLLAACEGDPFAKKYEPLGGQLVYKGLPKDMQQAFQALIKYVRTGGEGEAAITESIKEIKESPFSTILYLDRCSQSYTVPGTIPSEIIGEIFVKFVHPVYNFAYKVVDKNPTGPQTTLQTLFAERKQYNTRLGYDRRIPLQALLGFKAPPQNILLELDHKMCDKDVIVSPTLTLPAACIDQNQATSYKLTGAFRHPGEYVSKGTNNEDQLEGLTYFRWGNQWYKITSSVPQPEKTTEKEAQEAAADSGYQIDAFIYVYTREENSS